jgi:polysaccharide deacetylase 2 family uncharacterized protein YibQ
MKFKSAFMPWLLLFGLFLVVAVLFVVFQYSPEIIEITNGFESSRRVLNKSLREDLLAMGIRPELRDVIESRETYGETDDTWEVLNWVIRVSANFDFPYARNRLENTIHKNNGQFVTVSNPEDIRMPLKIDITVQEKLSHKLQFMVRQPKVAKPIPEPKVTENGPESKTITTKLAISQKLTNRWERLSSARQSLDLKLQRSLVAEELNKAPLFLSEYFENDVLNWVINVNTRPDMDQMITNLQASSGASVVRKRNLEGQKTVGCLEVSLADQLSHRIYFSTYALGRGAMAKKSSDDSAIYISPLRVALVIDDIGYDVAAAERLMDLDRNITLAILPYRPYSQDIAVKAYKRGVEVITHMPMQPASYPDVDPGRGKILVSQGPIEQQQITSDNIDAVPYAVGVNNHMGSRAMTDEKTVNSVLTVVKQKNMFFIDSRTIGNTIGFAMSRRLGVPSAERSVFLDSAEKNDINTTTSRLKDLLAKIKVQGGAIAIGHTSLETYIAIKQYLSKFRDLGIEFVYVSDLITY